jgi:uncharacterized membrane protein affecting hemolysin expression
MKCIYKSFIRNIIQYTIISIDIIMIMIIIGVILAVIAAKTRRTTKCKSRMPEPVNL